MLKSMLYRKSSPQPPRLLLRIVAAASAGAVVGACGGSGGPNGTNGGVGSMGLPPSDASEEQAFVVGGGTMITGVIAAPTPDGGATDAEPGASDAQSSDAQSSEAGDAHDAGDAQFVGGGTVVSGLVIAPDGGRDAGDN
jgi:hypothetical protein